MWQPVRLTKTKRHVWPHEVWTVLFNHPTETAHALSQEDYFRRKEDFFLLMSSQQWQLYQGGISGWSCKGRTSVTFNSQWVGALSQVSHTGLFIITGGSCHKYYFWCSKHFVVTNRQNMSSVTTKVCLSWQNLWHDKTSVATNICHTNPCLLWQAYFCHDKRCVLCLSWQR